MYYSQDPVLRWKQQCSRSERHQLKNCFLLHNVVVLSSKIFCLQLHMINVSLSSVETTREQNDGCVSRAMRVNGGLRLPLYLGADDLLREVGHGVGQPALQAFGKVTDGLSESAWRSFKVRSMGGDNTWRSPFQISISKLRKLCALCLFSVKVKLHKPEF